MEYDLEARRRLGRAIRAARTAAGFTNRTEFADKLKRSARQVQALENGESGVGPDTWGAAAQVLGWELDTVYALLENRSILESSPPPLASVSDEELAAEVLRRMKIGGVEDAERSATTKTPDVAVIGLGGVGRSDLLDEAARDVGRPGTVRRIREEQDQAGAPPADDPDDMEPR